MGQSNLKLNTLRAVRNYFNKQQKEVAAGINTTVSNYSRYENKEFLPETIFLKKLAEYYGCTIEFIENYKEPSIHVQNATNSVVANTIHTNNVTNSKEEIKEIVSIISPTISAINGLLQMLYKKIE